MIRFYSMFVTDSNILSSPYIRKLNLFHDISVDRGQEETINFLLQTSLTKDQAKELNVIFDPLAINITDVKVKAYKHQSLVTITLIPREVGSHKIGLAFPQSKVAHREKMKSLPSPLISTRCQKIHNDRVKSRENAQVV